MIYKSLFVSIIMVLLTSCGVKEDKVRPTIQTIHSSVYASVIVQPDSLYQVFSSVNGILESNLVEEGDTVIRHTPLVQIINSSSKLNSENARLAFNLAQKNYSGNTAILDGIKEEIQAARLKLKNDSINYYRQKNLWEQQIGSKAQFDAKKLEFELSAHSLKGLMNKYNRTKTQLQTQLEQASNDYKTSIIKKQDFTISSKINGTVYALIKNPGEIVNTQEPLAILGSTNQFIIEMLVDEVDIVTIKKGQEVVITIDAYAGETFTAYITKIYPNKDERNQTFKIEARFKSTPNTLYPGLSGEANIITAVKENALTIPREYLVNGNEVETEKGLVSVKVGLKNLDAVEILSGISEETLLYKPSKK
ncbi:efflux RND transporter periplasmic adaptor subunit [Spongiivirga citrea]|uniref:HlyD family efflux transporter periplasmic adaptor subunit n=1 Tax=Spongiivirga citrea TaxID=1481457 RepID=A0A6M0CG73_9FLAO|nr:efflux RND transporter periplasmic adaptor subunit [Spongiivirga citrea]NER16845.1 HlyD family efflux transporter periplasmic adaptor subunit [Spongiivirga citrea]